MNDWENYLKTLRPEERCPVCGQPDNCGDCNHQPLSEEDKALIMGADS